jgi:hypothetical protein
MRGKQKYSPGESRIWTLSWDNKSLQQEYWSFRDHKERVTEVEFPPGAGQWPGEITLKRLARYDPNNYFIFWPWDLKRKGGQRSRLHCPGGK